MCARGDLCRDVCACMWVRACSSRGCTPEPRARGALTAWLLAGRGPRASVLSAPSPQSTGAEAESRLLLIRDMATKLLGEDEVAAVLRHCTQVSVWARV